MRAKSVLQPKSVTNILGELDFITKEQKIKLILTVGDFDDWMVGKREVWDKMASMVIDKDYLTPQDQEDLKKDPENWFLDEWRHYDIAKIYLEALSEEEIDVYINLIRNKIIADGEISFNL